jgi:acetyltransferase-like isoleucine patch superfamily enzyme
MAGAAPGGTSDSNHRPWSAHSTAIIEDGSTIGAGTSLWHHVHVRAGATIGVDCNLGKNVYVDSGVNLGDRVRVQNNVSIYHGVEIADDVFLGPSCVFTNDLYPRASNPDWRVVPTHVHRGASIGANATIICGTTIGEWAVVGAGAVVTRDVAAHQLVVGNPAHHAGWVCQCGRVVARTPDRPAHLECTDCREART